MFKMSVDTSGITRGASDLELKQIPFAVSLGLNRIAIVGQKAEQARIKAHLKLRREPFIMQGIKIEKADRATKTSWSVVIRVAVPQDFLNRMEEGGLKTPTKNHWLWKPNSAVFNDKIITRSNPMHPMNLRFDAHNRGPLRTFMVKRNGKATGPLILQRTGAATTGGSHRDQLRTTQGRFDGMLRTPGQRKGKQGVRLLYTLVARTRVPKKLEFVNTIGNAVRLNWNSTMQQALGEAMRTAR